MATPGIDGCWAGPADLALSMGLDPRKVADDDRHGRALEQILAACRDTGKAPGLACPSPEEARPPTRPPGLAVPDGRQRRGVHARRSQVWPHRHGAVGSHVTCLSRLPTKSALIHSYREELSAPRNVAGHKRQLCPLRFAGSTIPPAMEPSQEFFLSAFSLAGALRRSSYGVESPAGLSPQGYSPWTSRVGRQQPHIRRSASVAQRLGVHPRGTGRTWWDRGGRVLRSHNVRTFEGRTLALPRVNYRRRVA